MQTRLPLDMRILLRIVRGEMVPAGIIFMIGSLFGGVGSLLALFADLSLGGWLFAGLFILIGLGALVLSIVTLTSSTLYHYEKAMLKYHGVPIDAVLYNKKEENRRYRETYISGDTTRTSRELIERDLVCEFRYQFKDTAHEGTFYLEDQELFDALLVPQNIQVRVLPQRPHVAYPNMRTLPSRLKRLSCYASNKVPSNVAIGGSLSPWTEQD